MSKHAEFLSKLDAIEHAAPPQPKEPEPTHEEKIVDVARAIDSAVEKITAVPVRDSEPDDEDEPTKPYRTVGEQVDDDSPIPVSTKIDFENLKFGKNA
jgi:hypothetical protein